MKIYVASSWRNKVYPEVVEVLRKAGHEVYDFRNPHPGFKGFSWDEIDKNWLDWTPEQYREGLEHPIAMNAFKTDMTALDGCDMCILVLPSGRSASWEFGYAIGAGKLGIVAMFEKQEPELMYSGNFIAVNMDELINAVGNTP